MNLGYYKYKQVNNKTYKYKTYKYRTYKYRTNTNIEYLNT